jgi:hypothetical protein
MCDFPYSSSHCSRLSSSARNSSTCNMSAWRTHTNFRFD